MGDGLWTCQGGAFPAGKASSLFVALHNFTMSICAEPANNGASVRHTADRLKKPANHLLIPQL